MITQTKTVFSRKYQIFISSTFQDLEVERAKAVDVVIKEGHLPIALEKFHAASKSVPDVIERAIEQSQIYLVILGHRYGSLVPNRRISYTELEYQQAIKKGLKVVPLVLNEAAIEKKRKALKHKKKKSASDRKEIANDKRFKKFHERVKRNRFYKPFQENDEEFHFLVCGALNEAVKFVKKPGWIREPKGVDLPLLLTSSTRNPFVSDVVERLGGKKLDTRFLKQPEKKSAAAKLFCNIYPEHMFRDREDGKQAIKLFLESGSTIAYVAKEIASSIKSGLQRDGKSIAISTNNVLAYLQFWLIHQIPCSLFPWGVPEDDYAGSYGPLDDLFKYKSTPIPEYPPRELGKKGIEGIEKLKNLPYNIYLPDLEREQSKEITLLLGATSGLQLDEKASVQSKAGNPCEIIKCYGPHVSSYKNKIFKRFMYLTRHPIMIFLTSEKINCIVKEGACHFVLDNESAWRELSQNQPLAFCVGCYQHEMKECYKKFEKLNFSILKGANYGRTTAFVARNPMFIELFEKRIGMQE